jgi:hypothetical protein
MSEFAIEGARDMSPVAIADGRSVDAALPLLLDELEEFVASLREDQQESFSVRRA